MGDTERGRVFLDTNVLVYLFDAGERAKQRRLLTEDMNHGQVIDGVRLENPFLASSAAVNEGG